MVDDIWYSSTSGEHPQTMGPIVKLKELDLTFVGIKLWWLR